MTINSELSTIATEPFDTAVSKFQDLISGCDGLAFLMGAGCSKCAGLPLINELTENVLNDPIVDCPSKQILTRVKDSFAQATDSHIEDYLSEIIDLLAITDRRTDRGVNKNTVTIGDAAYTAAELRNASNQIKQPNQASNRPCYRKEKGCIHSSGLRDFSSSAYPRRTTGTCPTRSIILSSIMTR